MELTVDGPIPRSADREWHRRAEGLRQRLASALPGRVAPAVTADYQGSSGDKNTDVWNVEYDGSAGWEVTSRVLSDMEGFAELDEACGAIDRAAADLGLVVNHRTGLHVHLGWLGRNVEELKRAVRLAKLFEPALATLVAPSRVARFQGGTYDLGEPNEFCRPVSSVFSANRLARVQKQKDFLAASEDHEARFVTFNMKPLEVLHTVEVRMHSGTIEARKILPWISLWMQILWAAAHRTDVPDVTDKHVLVPDGDVVALALEYLPDGRQPQQRTFLRYLVARRSEVVQQWARHPQLRPWLDHAMRWVNVPGMVEEA